eukprot:6206972-Pleurochrysis_carterae.AAC.1
MRKGCVRAQVFKNAASSCARQLWWRSCTTRWQTYSFRQRTWTRSRSCARVAHVLSRLFTTSLTAEEETYEALTHSKMIHLDDEIALATICCKKVYSIALLAKRIEAHPVAYLEREAHCEQAIHPIDGCLPKSRNDAAGG